jgi:dihydroorotase
VTLFDTEARWKVDPPKFVSKGRSTPFAGWELVGATAATIVAGDIVWQRTEL